MLFIFKHHVNRILLLTVLSLFFTNTLGIIGYGRGRGFRLSRGRGMSSLKETVDISESAVIEDEKVTPVDEQTQKEFLEVFDYKKPLLRVGDSPMPSEVDAKIKEIADIVKKHALFIDMSPDHLKAQEILTDLFRAQEENIGFMKLAKSLRSHPKLNFALWLRAFVMVSSERSELVGLSMPELFELIPEDFISTDQLSRKKGRSMDDDCVVMDEKTTSKGNDPEEQKLWYFREDIFFNVAHWKWHVDFHFTKKTKVDRRGEQFGYFHHTINARYAAERLSVGLKPVVPLVVANEMLLDEGYYSHLGDVESIHHYGDRPPKTLMKDMGFLVPAKDNLEADIKAQVLIHDNGTQWSTRDWKMVDVFGDLIESSSKFNINQDRYHNIGIHNQVHMDIADQSKGGSGVMATSQTAVRDPIFYRWHITVEKYFDDLRNALEPYQPKGGEWQLSWCLSVIEDLQVLTIPTSKEPDVAENTLYTQFKNVKLEFNITPAIESLEEFEPYITYCLKLLTHRPFEYKIIVNSNAKEEEKRSTVRIFMAPRFDLNGNRYSMEQQRVLFFAMDEFVVHLSPGKNTIIRSSWDSLLTTPARFEDSYSKLRRCGCGYPHHLLVPRGTKEGMVFDLFVMITNGEKDLPENYRPLDPAPCYSSHIVCGRHGERHPDARPLGYPFDRRPFSKGEKVVANIDEFVKAGKNMKTVQVKVVHNEIVG